MIKLDNVKLMKGFKGAKEISSFKLEFTRGKHCFLDLDRGMTIEQTLG